MTARMYYDKDADPATLAGQRIAILGYGSQGHAHALNLHDSGHDVIVGLPEASKSRAVARAAGLAVDNIADAVRSSDVVMVLVPDTAQADLFATEIKPNLRPGALLLFAHGFSVHFKTVVPPANVDVGMIAPKGPGHLVRRTYTEGSGVPCLFVVHQDATGNARGRVLAYGRGIGGTRAGMLETTFKEETETDLFGEQAVLCGGISSLVKAGFDTLIEAGYQEELAYFEVMHELKLIVDLMYQGGLNYMRYSVSDTAEFGDYVSGPRIVNDETRATMRQLLKEIQDGSFARTWIAENKAGRSDFNELRKRERAHPIEAVGASLRERMSWLDAKTAPDQTGTNQQSRGNGSASGTPTAAAGAQTDQDNS